METLMDHIAKLYGISHVQVSEKVAKGFLSENYILSDGATKYFLKKNRFNKAEKIEEIHSVKKYFSHNGIPVILPLNAKDGRSFFLWESNYYALFPFTHGKQLERENLTEKAIVSLAKMLGRIHLVGKNCTLVLGSKFHPWDKADFLWKADILIGRIQEIDDKTEFDELALQSVLLKKSLVEKNTLTYDQLGFLDNHLLHGDYLDHNVFFGDDDEVAWVFDFEKTSRGPRVYELFRSLCYSLLGGKIDEKDIKRAKLYVKSYNSIYPLSVEEITKGLQFFYLKSIHNLWVESEHYFFESNRVDLFLKEDFQRVVYLSENMESLANALSIS